MLYERNKAGHKQAFETFEFETIESQSSWLSWKNYKGGHKQALLDEKSYWEGHNQLSISSNFKEQITIKHDRIKNLKGHKQIARLTA